MGFLDFAETEGGKTNLNEGTIVHNLVISVLLANNLTHMSLHHQVSSFSKLIMNSQVINLLECSSNTLSWVAPLVD